MTYQINQQLMKKGLEQLIRDKLNILERTVNNGANPNQIDICTEYLNQCLIVASFYLSQRKIDFYQLKASEIIALQTAGARK